MTKEEMKSLLPIITAYTEGRTIEWYSKGQWTTFEDGIFADAAINFRVKPEPQLVPFTFEDVEFLVGKWIKVKGTKSAAALATVNVDGVRTYFNSITFVDLMLSHTFLDGTPCGKYTTI